jgi:serine/threonine-protein kinase
MSTSEQKSHRTVVTTAIIGGIFVVLAACIGLGVPIVEYLVNRRATSPAPTETPMSAPKLGDTQLRSVDGMVMVYVPAGAFDMGSSDYEIDRELQLCNLDLFCERSSFEGEQPVHTVYLDAFWIDGTEVTNAQYQLCVATGECSPPTESSSNTRDSYFGNKEYDDYPAIYVSWDQAANYCKWIGGRLPTEAEWEYAARGPQRNIFPWGNDRPDNTLLNYNGNVGDTAKVGTYRAGTSWCGAMDMAGNVWEWVNDWFSYDYYKRSPPQNPRGPASGEVHGLRGGAWNSSQHRVRTAQRDYYTDEWSPPHLVGFRCVVLEK